MEDQYISAFAKRITDLRMKKGISARDMSLSLGLSHNYIHNIESENNYPNMYNFFIICEYLGISPKDFFDYTNTNPKKDNDLYDALQRLDADAQDSFLRLVNDFNSRSTIK